MIQAGSSFRVAKRQTMMTGVVPAPIQGMNGRVNAATNSPQICLWAINMLPAEYGTRVRSGYREWQIGMNEEVRTLITYTGVDGTFQTANKIFAVTQTGIWDVTTAAGTPNKVLTFATSSEDSGWGNYTHYTSEAGSDLIFYADGANGLFTYTASTDTWAQTTGITAASGAINTFDVTKVAYVVVHKLRIWLVEKGQNHAWYLGVRAIAGDATEFFFASKFRNGGEIVGLFNWTVDGGNGRDDHLVAVGRGGDVIPWTGEDPSDDLTWTSTGTFYVGRIPRGNRVASEYGGELYILSTLGVTAMSDLLQGGNPEDPYRNNIGYNVARLLRQDLDVYQDIHGWNLKFITHDGSLLISCPQRSDGSYRQYVYNLATQGWGLWKDVPLLTSEPFDGKLMVGTKDGRILRMDVESDNVLLDGSSRTSIKWFLLTSYNDMGSPGIFKRVHFIRPNFLSDSQPSFEVFSFFDYLISLPLPPSDNTEVKAGTWDNALWDFDQWGTGESLPYSSARGGTGMGRSVAVALSGTSFESDFLASIDVSWSQGGFL